MAKQNKRKQSARLAVPSVTDHYSILHQELDTHTERGAILACAAVVDCALEQLLRCRLKPMSDATEKEIDFFLTERPLPPLGSFGIRIRAAHLLGFISRSTYTTLARLVSIRNTFAHTETVPTLDDELVGTVWAAMPLAYRDPYERMKKQDDTPISPIRAFVYAAATVLCILKRSESDPSFMSTLDAPDSADSFGDN